MRTTILGAAVLLIASAESLAQTDREVWRANVILSLTDPVDGTTWTVERLSLLEWRSEERCEMDKGGVRVDSRFIGNLENAGTWKTASGEPPVIELVDLVCTQLR